MAIMVKKAKGHVERGLSLLCAAAAFSCVSCASSYTAAISNPLPQGEVEMVDDFEDENDFWSAVGIFQDADCSLETDLSDEWCSAGEYCGEWSFANIPQGGSASFVCESLITNDWSGAQALLADVNNVTQGPVELFVEVECGSSHEIFCTSTETLGVGENVNVIFRLDSDLRDKDGRSAVLRGDEDVRCLSFKIQGKKAAGTILIDEIRLLK